MNGIEIFCFSLFPHNKEFSIGVPFYDRSELNEKREDAYLAMQRDADYVAPLNTDDTAQDWIHAAPTILTRNGTLLQGPPPSANCQRASTHQLRIL